MKGSGVVPAIRLMKLWARRRGVSVKTFALELLTIDLLAGKKKVGLPEQLTHVLTEFANRPDSLSVSDPANANNDLSEMLNAAVRFSLEYVAENTLESVENDGWESVYGPVEAKEKVAALAAMAAKTPVRPKPYHGGPPMA